MNYNHENMQMRALLLQSQEPLTGFWKQPQQKHHLLSPEEPPGTRSE
jgi:hypothetical protein